MPQQRWLLLCLLASFSLFLSAETRHIHVIQMLDDNSPTYLIREGCRSIDYGIQREIDRMQDALGISDVHYYRLNGMHFSREALEFVVDYQLAYQERDIIVFVYAGHGYRDRGSSHQLPKLYFRGYHDALEGDELRIRLLEKNPSVLINLVVACNAFQGDHRSPPRIPEDNGPTENRLSGTTRSQKAYQVLFSDQEGYTKVIDLVSADREYETFMSRDGGIFFSEVLYAFEEVFGDERLTNWPAICNYIKGQTLQRSAARKLPQQPYCVYQVFRSLNESTITVRAEATTVNTLSCRAISRQLRRQQKLALKQLRRRHRQEIRNLSDAPSRKLAAARHRQETSQMKYVHLQDYQRKSGQCK
jgi:hypothetical protein